MAEAEKYLGTQSTHTNQSTQPKTPPKKNYSFSILLFILGIVAVAVLAVFTSMRKLPSIVLISELIVLASLIGLLLVSISAKRRMVRQFALNERYPYANVEKKEIEAIFDKIAEEEKKRRKLNAFASGVDLSKMPTVTASKALPEENDGGSDNNTADKKADGGSSDEEDSGIIAVFPDDEESSGNEKSSGDAENGDKDSDKNGESGESGKDRGDDKKEKRPASKRPEGDGERPRKKRPSEDERQRSRKQRPYDPYYEDYYYDSNGKRRRAPVYYDEYGNPIRPRVVYDEYGNPIRRRPADPRRAPDGKRRRPPYGTGQKRPASSSNASGSHTGKKKRRVPSGPVAPVEMTPIKQHSNYGDDYVPVAIVDEEEDYVPAPKASKPAPKKRRPANAAEAAESAQRNPYVPQYDDDIVAVLEYDDEDTDSQDYTPASKTREQQADNSSGKKRRPVPEKYVPDYSDEEPVIALPDYDDDDDAPARPYQRQQAAAASSAAGYDDEDEDEDEPLVVLPRDEGYEEYMENKQSAARKAERKAKGQTALTIRKVRHKKIRRKSRKYKIFRASVHTLTEYLNSFAVKSRR